MTQVLLVILRERQREKKKERETEREREREIEREREKERGENPTFIYFEAFTVLMRPQHEMNRQKL